MGHREELLASAKRCLSERGYARTTARDLVEASNTNLASIGYHFGSKEALLNEAMKEAIEDWGRELGQSLAAELDPDATPMERFVATWARFIESLATHRVLWIGTIEAVAQAERSSEVRTFLGDSLERGREGLPVLFRIGPVAPAEQHAVGSVLQALTTGVGMQWLVDPQRAPSAEELAVGLEAIARDLLRRQSPAGRARPPRRVAKRVKRGGKSR
jgi:AcrR family transcriptional regulator